MNNTIQYITDIYRGYFCPVIFVFGTLGNIFIILTFAYNFNNKFVIYCCALALYNSIALLTNTFMDDFLGRGLAFLSNNSITIQVDELNQSMCLFMEYIPNVMYFSSSYVMVAFSLDRTLVLALPIKYSPYRGYKFTIFICIGLGIMGAAVASPLLFSYDLVKRVINSTEMTCALVNPKMVEFGLYLKSFVIFVIPTILVGSFNTVIYFLLLRTKKRRQHLSCRKSSRGSPSEMGKIVAHLALSTVFLLLTIPLSVTIILRLILKKNPNANYSRTYSSNIIHLTKLLSSIKDLSYAVNFFLYLIFIPSFKFEFLSIFKGDHRLRHVSMGNSISMRS